MILGVFFLFAQILRLAEDSDAVIKCANGFRMNFKMPHDLHHKQRR